MVLNPLPLREEDMTPNVAQIRCADYPRPRFVVHKLY